MVRRCVFGGTLAVLAWLGTGSAWAEPIRFRTGNVEIDMPSNNPRVLTIIDNPDPITGQSNPNDVAQARWMTDRGYITGFNIKDVRLYYDAPNDRLMVGVNFFSIAGDADGDGNPGHASAMMRRAGGIDEPNLGGQKSITVGFDLDNSGKPDIVSGVPAIKPPGKDGIQSFTLAEYTNDGRGLGYSYGKTLEHHVGELAHNPSRHRPHFQFTIENFSELPGLDLNQGFGIMAFAGSPFDVIAGEDNVPLTHVMLPKTSPQVIPEPSTVLAWTLAAGAVAGLRLSRRRQRA